MDDNSVTTSNSRNIWMRALFMLLMALAYQVTGMLVFVVTVVQFALVLLTDTPNKQLVEFGRSLGRYFQQLVDFLTFSTERLPFPFSVWPSGD